MASISDSEISLITKELVVDLQYVHGRIKLASMFFWIRSLGEPAKNDPKLFTITSGSEIITPVTVSLILDNLR